MNSSFRLALFAAMALSGDALRMDGGNDGGLQQSREGEESQFNTPEQNAWPLIASASPDESSSFIQGKKGLKKRVGAARQNILNNEDSVIKKRLGKGIQPQTKKEAAIQSVMDSKPLLNSPETEEIPDDTASESQSPAGPPKSFVTAEISVTGMTSAEQTAAVRGMEVNDLDDLNDIYDTLLQFPDFQPLKFNIEIKIPMGKMPVGKLFGFLHGLSSIHDKNTDRKFFARKLCHVNGPYRKRLQQFENMYFHSVNGHAVNSDEAWNDVIQGCTENETEVFFTLCSNPLFIKDINMP